MSENFLKLKSKISKFRMSLRNLGILTWRMFSGIFQSISDIFTHASISWHWTQFPDTLWKLKNPEYLNLESINNFLAFLRITTQGNPVTNCLNTDGSFTCECASGFQSDNGIDCLDIDECAQDICNIDSQQQPAECVNFEGGWQCECAVGFIASTDQDRIILTYICMNYTVIVNLETKLGNIIFNLKTSLSTRKHHYELGIITIKLETSLWTWKLHY